MAKVLTQAQVVSHIAGETGLSRRDVQKVLDEQRAVALSAIGRGGPGKFKIPGIVQIERKHTKARTYRNPMTGGTVRKPAGTRIKARVLSEAKGKA